MGQIPLRALAHSRAGDKGSTVNIAVFPYEEKNYEVLVEQLTTDEVNRYLNGIAGSVERYLVPNIPAINFVLRDVEKGDVTTTLALDYHGKTLCYHLLEMPIKI
ncbi:MAG TPA: hypothetical protein GXZ27_00415 [Thermoanaerobacterales bacterium]|jgi:hypothetical protein|nr:hypothetical protein [Thermoanaerobacterales bacterium]